MEKSVVLLDAGNIIAAWWKYCENNRLMEKIDYIKLIRKISEGTDLLRAYFYDGVPENLPIKKKNFLEALQKQGIQLRTKVLKNRTVYCDKCQSMTQKQIQKGVDVSLATDILRHAYQKTCSVCIIVSGDEDYKDAMEVAKDLGIRVWVCSFKDSLSSEVEKTADKVILIEKIFKDVKKDLNTSHASQSV